MIKLEKPKMNQKDIINDCIENMREGPVKERIKDSVDEIVCKSLLYDKKAEKEELSSIKIHSKLENGATKADMIKLYDNKFVPQKEKGRIYYDAIKLLAKNNKCPYCGQREVSTLDHYLPKALYPTYAVTSYNLVPSCKDCNFGKLDTDLDTRENEVIHPYYDDFSTEKWIVAEMIEEEPIAFEFKVQCPKEWDVIKQKRAEYHFKCFDLNDLYKPYASEEFMCCYERIKRLYKRGGKALAIENLKEEIEDRDRVRLNTWQSAMYQAVIDSNWFWDEYLPSKL